MLKPTVILAGAALFTGSTLLYDPDVPSVGAEPGQDAYMVAAGLVFGEAAVREALPEGLEPAAGFTGGVVLQGGDAGWPLSPLTTGFVWIDVAAPGHIPGQLDRYLLSGFYGDEVEKPLVHDASLQALSDPVQPGDKVQVSLRLPSDVRIDLDVQRGATDCQSQLSVAGPFLTTGPDGRLGVIHMPQTPPLCVGRVQAARIEAPEGHLLEGFAPTRALWGAAARPLQAQGSAPAAD